MHGPNRGVAEGSAPSLPIPNELPSSPVAYAEFLYDLAAPIVSALDKVYPDGAAMAGRLATASPDVLDSELRMQALCYLGMVATDVLCRDPGNSFYPSIEVKFITGKIGEMFRD